jgi:hypothetical protein
MPADETVAAVCCLYGETRGPALTDGIKVNGSCVAVTLGSGCSGWGPGTAAIEDGRRVVQTRDSVLLPLMQESCVDLTTKHVVLLCSMTCKRRQHALATCGRL